MAEEDPPGDRKRSYLLPGGPNKNTPEFLEFYGNRSENRVTIPAPFVLKIAWDLRLKATKITCH
ncbi:hypothetical protein SAMN05192553_101542 [Cyclobacterium xiamenense]|uniref:Uncharacterized protein n=1 Tax=Cyclobacterium xiamenense TaxID=1297121 RepID=A0A1H6U1A5_9BACT|nr:hypothetical protein [Cyclobacterium xiamenense]SEI85266.1 hypothetical protein SAMN05192553_101542 [Cyclobacterium xiamenense]